MESIKFYHNPMSRSAMVQWMLEEVEAQYDTTILSFEKGEHKSPDYLVINAMGKVPTIVHRGTAISETPAIIAYLADLFADKKLAPDIGDPKRGLYYQWLVFGSGCIEPAVIDKALKRTPPERPGMLGYGSYEDTFAAIEKVVTQHQFLLGEQFSGADLYIASQLHWGIQFNTVEANSVFIDYVARCHDRPGYRRFLEKNQTEIKSLRP